MVTGMRSPSFPPALNFPVGSGPQDCLHPGEGPGGRVRPGQPALLQVHTKVAPNLYSCLMIDAIFAKVVVPKI